MTEFTLGKILILAIIFFSSLIYALVPNGIEYIDYDLEDRKCPNCEEYNLYDLKLKEGHGYVCKSCGKVYWIKKNKD